MNQVEQAFLTSAETKRISMIEIDREARYALRQRLQEKFTWEEDDREGKWFPSQWIESSVRSALDVEGFRWMKKFLEGVKDIIAFFPRSKFDGGFEFQSGSDAFAVVPKSEFYESPRIDTYLTNKKCEFLIYYWGNENVLYTAGTASNWFDELTNEIFTRAGIQPGGMLLTSEALFESYFDEFHLECEVDSAKGRHLQVEFAGCGGISIDPFHSESRTVKRFILDTRVPVSSNLPHHAHIETSKFVIRFGYRSVNVSLVEKE